MRPKGADMHLRKEAVGKGAHKKADNTDGRRNREKSKSKKRKASRDKTNLKKT